MTCSINMEKWSLRAMTKNLLLQRLMMMLKACHVSSIIANVLLTYSNYLSAPSISAMHVDAGLYHVS
jgi:hypothetical protein